MTNQIVNNISVNSSYSSTTVVPLSLSNLSSRNQNISLVSTLSSFFFLLSLILSLGHSFLISLFSLLCCLYSQLTKSIIKLYSIFYLHLLSLKLMTQPSSLSSPKMYIPIIIFIFYFYSFIYIFIFIFINLFFQNLLIQNNLIIN